MTKITWRLKQATLDVLQGESKIFVVLGGNRVVILRSWHVASSQADILCHGWDLQSAFGPFEKSSTQRETEAMKQIEPN